MTNQLRPARGTRGLLLRSIDTNGRAFYLVRIYEAVHSFRDERDILCLIAEGLGNVEIGGRLSISEKTVRNHISSLYDKLGVWTRAQAIVFARDRGFQATQKS